jgi:PAS domain S-box-containing protein
MDYECINHFICESLGLNYLNRLLVGEKMPKTTLREPVVALISDNPIHVLHVDDDEALLCVAKQCLEMQSNVEVESVQSAEEALELLKNKKFDVIVSDYQMRRKNGLEFLHEMKTMGITTPFILFTGKGRDEIAVKALNSGAFRYMDKRGAPDAAYAELALCIRQASQYARAQQMLRESEKRFRAIFDSSTDAILVLDDAGSIVYSNKSAKGMLDSEKDQITKALNKHFDKQFTATYEQNMQRGFKQLSDGSLSMTGKTVELAIKKASGETASVELSFSAFTENGQWYGVSIVRDVSERKRQEQLLEESRQALKALFSYNPGAIAFLDRDFRVMEINPSFTELFKFTPEETKGKKIKDIIVPDGFEEETSNLEEQILKGPVSFSTTRKRKDGSPVSVGLAGGPLIVNGKVHGYFLAFVDISDLIFVQNVLDGALSHAELLNEKIRVLGGFTRHDVRNKLGLIQGNLYLFRKKSKIEPEYEKYLNNIDDSIKNICEILDFAKTYEMIGVEELVPVDIGKIFQNAVSLFSDLKGVKIENQCIGLELIADSLLTQVFYNLIDNSLKYGEKTTIIRVFAEKLDDQSIRLYFKDDGVGLDKKFKEHLFERGVGKGTGLGLYFIRKICEVYSWSVRENSQTGQGAQFEFLIPAEKVKRYVEN